MAMASLPSHVGGDGGPARLRLLDGDDGIQAARRSLILVSWRGPSRL